MSKGKQNTFLPVYFAVLGVGTLGLGYLAFSASSTASEAEESFKKAQTELNDLERKPLSRTLENAAKKKELVDAYLKQVAGLNASLAKLQSTAADAADPQAFQKKLQKVATDIANSAKERNIKLPDKFDFGMNKYMSEFASDAAMAGALGAQLDGLNHIVTAAIESGVRSIDSFSREQIAAEKEPAAGSTTGSTGSASGSSAAARRRPTPARSGAAVSRTSAKKEAAGPALPEDKVIERQAVRMTVTGRNKSITALLEALSNASAEKPHFVNIRVVRVENQEKNGPPRAVDVREEEIKPEGGGDPYILDAAFVVGDQAVRAYIDMDLLRFLPDESEEKRTSGDAGEKPAN
jgi:hypothetical protein